MRRSTVIVLAGLALAGCTLSFPEVDDAPTATGGQVVGQVVLPAAQAELTLGPGHVELSAAGAPTRQAALGEEGRFSFDAVPAGAWLLTVRVYGFAGGLPAVDVREGERTDVGAVPLTMALTGRVRGVATRAGGDTHAGIVVEVVGDTAVAVTDPAGDYTIETVAGPRTLRFSLPGHAPGTAEVVVEPDDVIDAPPVMLAALPGRLRGTVALPEGLDDAAILRQTVATLTRPTGEDAREASPDDAGRLLFEAVPAGAWMLALTHPTLTTPMPAFVHLGPEEDQSLGVLPLGVGAPARLEGVARLAGASDDGHAGIAVEVAGVAARAQTASDGAWALEVPPLTTYALRLRHPGYEGVDRDLDGLAPGATAAVEAVVLSARAGRVQGALAARGPDGAVRAFDEALRAGTTLTLRAVDDPEAAPRVESPVGDGRFTFEDVPPGAYALQIELTGFDPPPVPAVDVAPGATVNLGVLDLAPRVDAAVRGRVLLECAGLCDHGGTRVEAAGTPFVTFTGSDGAFRLPINEGTHDLVFSHPGYRSGRVDRLPVAGTVVLPAQPPLALLPVILTGVVERLLPTGGATAAADVQVALRGADGPLETVTTDAEGRFRITVTAPAGTYALAFRLDRHADHDAPVVLAPGGETALGAVLLQPLRGPLTGRVSLPAGRPGTVQVRGVADDLLTAGVLREITVAPPEGRFAVDRLPVGRYAVTARAIGARPAAAADVAVTLEGAPAVDLTLDALRAAVALPESVSDHPTATITADADLTHLRVWADQVEPPADATFAALPDAADLDLSTLPEGPHTLRIELANAAVADDPDAHGALRTAPLTLEVLLDRAPPVIRRVELANGQTTVNALTVPLTFEGAGERVAVWNDAGDACAAAPACPDGAGWVPYADALTHTLSGPQGPKRVCWRVCDAACNCTDGVEAVTLADYIARPTPTLTAVSPAELAVDALAELPLLPPELGALRGLTLRGAGIADDTVVQIGDEIFPCRALGDAAGCTADADGACAGEPAPAPDPTADACADRCAGACYVALGPDDRLLRNAGTYPVRLRSPAPVTGAGTSAALSLDVVSPVPRIASTSPRGALVVDLRRPEQLSLFTFGPEVDTDLVPPIVPASLTVEIVACRVADNTQFRLGGNVGVGDPDTPPVIVPTPTEGPCTDEPTRRYRLTFATDALPDLPPDQHAIVAINPGPGGGEARAPFGVNRFEGDCMIAGRCAGALPSTAKPTRSGAGHHAAFQLDTRRPTSGIAWWGGDLIETFTRYGAHNAVRINNGTQYLPDTAFQLRRESAGGLSPPMYQDPFALAPTTLDGPQPRVVLRAVTRRGDGRFDAAALATTTGRGLADIAVSDFDEDGRLDLATADCGADAISLRLQQADGSVDRGDTLTMGRCPAQLRVADLNSDGHADLVAAAGEGVGRLHVRLGRGDGSFAPAVRWSVPPEDTDNGGTAGLALGDLDHDGHVDLVAAGAHEDGGRLVWRHGLGTGNFVAARAVAPPEDLPALGAAELVDLDRDRRLDLVVLEAAGGLRVYRGTGGRGDEPAFEAPWRAALPGAVALAHGDLDADTLPDVVVGGCAGVTVLRGVGDGTLAPGAPLAGPDCVTDVVLADVTGDGRADVVAGHAGGGVTIFRGDGRGGLALHDDQALPDGAGPTAVAVADLDADGALDLWAGTRAQTPGTVYGLAGLGREAFGPPRLDLPAGVEPWNIVPGDLDGDAWPDLVVLDRGLPGLLTFLNDGAGQIEQAVEVDTPGRVPISARVADLDGDGEPELLVAFEDEGPLAIYPLGADGTPGAPRAVPLPAGCAPRPDDCAATAPYARDRLQLMDLDGDGALELVTGCGANVAVLGDYDPATGFAAADVLTDGEGCTAGVAAIDVDGERGVVAPFSWQETMVYVGGQPFELAGFPASSTVAYTVADVDHDGRDDIFRHQRISRNGEELIARRAWTHDGALTRDALVPAGGEWWHVRAADLGGTWNRVADLDGDGYLDRLWNHTRYPRLQLTLGWDAPFLQTWDFDENAVFDAPGLGTGVSAVDLDRDGALDLLATTDRVGRMSLWRGPAAGTWTLYHRPWIEPVDLAPGVPRTINLPHGRYVAHRLAARVRVEGQGLGGTTAALITAAGTRIDLGEAPAGTEGVWQLVVTEDDIDLSAGHGPQPNDPWQFVVVAPEGAAARVTDVELAAFVSFHQTRPGTRAARPEPLRWAEGAQGKVVAGDTLGGVDATTLSCADTTGGPEAWYQLELAEVNAVELRLAAAFDGAVEVRAGACADGGAAVACAAGPGAHIDATALPAGDWCVVVDGRAAARAQLGPFDLFLRAATPVTPRCDADCEGPGGPDITADDPGVVICPDFDRIEPSLCDTRAGFACCLGQFTSCDRGCGGVSVPALCDGPEDCPGDLICCAAFTTGAACAASCAAGAQTLCRSDADCDGVACTTCPVPLVGELSVCADDCAGVP